MMEARLQSRLGDLAHLRRRARLWRALAGCWAAGAVVGFALLLTPGIAALGHLWVIPLLAGIIAGVVVLAVGKYRLGEVQELINELEPQEPGLRHLLSAAAEQRPAEASGSLGFLQLRVIEEALAHPRQEVWRRQLERRLAFAKVAHAGSFVALLAIALVLNRGATHGASVLGSLIGEEITVTPGDARVERGTGLVIAARFGGTPPVEATLVWL